MGVVQLVLWIFMTVFCYCSLIVPWLSSLLSPYSRFTLPLRSCFPFRRPNHSLPRPPVAKNLKCLLFSSVYLSACVYFLPICLSLSVCLPVSVSLSVCLSYFLLSVCLSFSLCQSLWGWIRVWVSLFLSLSLLDSLIKVRFVPFFIYPYSPSFSLFLCVCLSLSVSLWKHIRAQRDMRKIKQCGKSKAVKWTLPVTSIGLEIFCKELVRRWR